MCRLRLRLRGWFWFWLRLQLADAACASLHRGGLVLKDAAVELLQLGAQRLDLLLQLAQRLHVHGRPARPGLKLFPVALLLLLDALLSGRSLRRSDVAVPAHLGVDQDPGGTGPQREDQRDLQRVGGVGEQHDHGADDSDHKRHDDP